MRKNWLAWKTHIHTIFRQKVAFEIATGVTPQPQDPDDAAVWTQKDLPTQEIITHVIENKQVLSVSECNTAAEMWESLHFIHEPHGQQSILSIKCALYSAQAKEGSNIALHLGYMKILHKCLAMSGHWIDHVEFKSILVTSLPHSWESFTSLFFGYQGSTQGNQQAEVMTMQQLVSLLIEEAKQKNEKEKGAKFAFLAGSNPIRVNGNLAKFVSRRIMPPQIAGSKGNPNAISVTNLGIRTRNVGRIPRIKERERLQRA